MKKLPLRADQTLQVNNSLVFAQSFGTNHCNGVNNNRRPNLSVSESGHAENRLNVLT